MLFRLILFLICAAVILFGIPRLITGIYAAQKTYTPSNAPKASIAIVFGAGLLYDGSPTSVLRDRVEVAAQLYFAGKVKKLLMSGDNSYLDYNEPGAMLEYALSLGVPREDIVLDYAGRRTYDTCYRAKMIFGVQDSLLVTQQFHLPRAIFLCNMLGVQGVGVNADIRTYNPASLTYWNMRELPATLVALTEAWITHPVPVLGKVEPIFPNQNNPIP